MARTRRKREIIGLDLTPLIDVVFLLIIFFMVSTTFNKYGQINIELPTSSVEKEVENNDFIEIVIDKDGNYYLHNDGKNTPVTIAEFPNILKNIKEVSITGDKNLKYQIVIDTISEIKKCGIENVGINFYE